MLVALTNELVIQGQGAKYGYELFNKPLCDALKEIKLHHSH